MAVDIYICTMHLSIGDKAPDFVLISSENEEWRLSDHLDQQTLILFFPFAYTGVCTTELCSMRDDITRYADLKTRVIGISVDSPFTLAKFKADNNLPFTMLSDFNKSACRAYGSIYEEFVLGLRGVAKRSAFIVDAEGIIRYAEVLDDAGSLPNFDAIHAVLG